MRHDIIQVHSKQKNLEEQIHIGISHYELTACLLLYLQFKDTPLHKASSDGHEVVVDMLLKAGDNPSAVNQV